METVQQNGRFTLFSIKFLSIYSILYEYISREEASLNRIKHREDIHTVVGLYIITMTTTLPIFNMRHF